VASAVHEGAVIMNTLIAVAALLLAACLDQTTDIEPTEPEPVALEPAAEGLNTEARIDESAPSVCSEIVATDGPCAVACEPLKLKSYIPNGTCATFVCDLEDGTQWRTGGCNR
jgi:hypothetical protein